MKKRMVLGLPGVLAALLLLIAGCVTASVIGINMS